jgi:hypothetical protein
MEFSEHLDGSVFTSESGLEMGRPHEGDLGHRVVQEGKQTPLCTQGADHTYGPRWTVSRQVLQDAVRPGRATEYEPCGRSV